MRLKYRVIERLRSKYKVTDLCRILEVSRSGYYSWRNRQSEPPKDQWLIEQIVECQRMSKQTYGYNRVQLWLEKVHKIRVNRKTVIRIMRKLDLLSQIRRPRSYVRHKQAAFKYADLLKRAFYQSYPNRFWATDITYIPVGNKMLYLCAVIDLCGKMVLAYRIGDDMTASLVTDTIRDALQKEKVTDGLTLHSDQGSQYASQAYFDLSQEYHFSPSMSSPGCPYDNAAMENFFGTLKSECLYLTRFSSRQELAQLIDEYIYFYNFERITLNCGLTPYEIRSKAA